MADFPTFDAFYRAVHGGDRAPFPWQRRLADLVVSTTWPTEIGIPTGLGKTSCLDVAIWAMVAEAELAASTRRMPTRVWYVVNRRLLVDAAWEHGVTLGTLLADPERAPGGRDARHVLSTVATALRRRGGGGAMPLHVTRLRGGAELGARPPDPSQPAVVFATVAMFASRWLFRGYGTSDTMRPIDAALAGTDSLVLLDEAHLARPLLSLGEPLAQCDLGDPSSVLPAARARARLVSLTATGDAHEAFGLDQSDREHPVVAQRLGAHKPLALVKTPKARLPAALANEVTGHLDGRAGAAAVVFANSPATARAVYEELSKATARRAQPLRADLVLLTGRMREREAAAVRDAVLDPVLGAPAGSSRRARTAHLVVVATQTLEVGADLDFDVMVSEACGARAVVQRLGRLNRLGERDAAGSLVLAEGEQSFGIYGSEPLEVWDRLETVAVDGCVALGPEQVATVLGAPNDAPPRVGELLPAHLWEWAKTTTAPAGEAPVELFFDAMDAPDASVSLLWRAVLPDPGSELVPGAAAAESIDVPVWEARATLQDIAGNDMVRLAADRVTVEAASAEELRPGDVVVLSARAGRYDAFGWNPKARTEVLDVSLLGPPGVPLDPVALGQLAAPGEELAAALALAKVLAEPPDPDDERDPEAPRALVERLAAAGPSPLVSEREWGELLARIRPDIRYSAGEPAGRLVVPPRSRMAAQADLRADAFDELSFTATSPDLYEHVGSVGEVAARIARELGLPTDLVEAVRAAGRFHDLGKADQRFQRWLDPAGTAHGLSAKSASTREHWERDRMRAGWPRGGRHEELSRRLLACYLDTHMVEWDADLVVHLVVSHHGYGRPLVPAVRDAAPTAVSATVDGAVLTARGDLSEVDWGQPARFRRCCERYGYWGLALLEAIVRQADHQVSKVVVA